MNKTTDTDLGRKLSTTLLAAFLTGMAVVGAGLGLFLARYGLPSSVGRFRALPVQQLPARLMQGSSIALMDVGLVFILLTPALVTLLAAVLFARKRQGWNAAMAFAVLALLIASLLLQTR